MNIKTERLIVREFEKTDRDDLLKIKYDEAVLFYDPEFIKRDASESDASELIDYFISQRDTGDFSREIYYAVCLIESGELIGAITVSIAGYLRETQIGWMFSSRYNGNGYASEAGKAVSDYILRTYKLDYMIVVMDVDNPASFRTAQKSGFRLFEKRVPYDYFYSKCDVESFDDVGGYFANNQTQTGSCYYYFRKYNPDKVKDTMFYGDTLYTGRFS